MEEESTVLLVKFSIFRYVHVEIMTMLKLLNALYVIKNFTRVVWEYLHLKLMPQKDLFVLFAGIFSCVIIIKISTDGKPHLELARTSARKASKKRKNVSSSLYLGYVEDSESVDEIMKKFKCLEEYQKKKKICSEESKQASENGNSENTESEDKQNENLSTEDLEEIFKMTSSFDVEALDDGDIYTDEMNSDSDNYDVNDESSESDEEFYNEYLGRDFDHRSTALSMRGFIPDNEEKVLLVTNDANGNLKAIQKVKISKPHTSEYIKIPKQLPLSWAIRFYPYEDPRDVMANSHYLVSNDILHDKRLLEFTDLQGILIDPPYHAITPEDLLSFKSIFQKILKAGIIFIWSDRQHEYDLLKVMENIGYFYVENVTWVKKSFNNEFVKTPGEPFECCKETLLMLRRGMKTQTGNLKFAQLEIRHQRNPDVIMDFARPNKLLRGKIVDDKPQEELYHLIETLLPGPNPEFERERKRALRGRGGGGGGGNNGGNGGNSDDEEEAVEDYYDESDIRGTNVQRSGKNNFMFLELWGQKDKRRKGWINVYEDFKSE